MQVLQWPSILILVVTLWGCAGVKERQVYSISNNQAIELDQQTANTSDFLGTEISKLIDEYRAPGVLEEEKEIPEFGNHEWLKHLFSLSDVETIMPDSAFVEVRNLSGNTNVEVLEDFYDSLASFVVDGQYHCSRPIYYRYFAARYGDNQERLKCKGRVPFLVIGNLDEPKVVWVDLDSVSSIHLLFAGEGKAMMSRFGHIMFRLIICPEKEKSTDKCDQNLSQHLVLGYRAHIDDFKIDSLAGLLGGYRSYLLANQFMDVYQEYAIGEFREMYSLPILLDAKERSDFVRALAEVHWGYAGEYRFLTSNCSTLAQNFMSNIWREFGNLEVMQSVYWRPDTFFSTIKATSLTASKKISNLDTAEREGFYFSSAGPIYENALEKVKSAMSEPDFDTLNEYLMRNPLVRKRDVLGDKAYFQALRGDAMLLSGQILLEELAVVRAEQQLLGEIAYFFDVNDVSDIDDYLKTNLDKYDYKVFSSCLLNPVLKAISPIKRRNGIPDDSAIFVSKNELVDCGDQIDGAAVKRVVEKMSVLDRTNWQKVTSLADYWASSISNVIYYTDIENEGLADQVSH